LLEEAVVLGRQLKRTRKQRTRVAFEFVLKALRPLPPKRALAFYSLTTIPWGLGTALHGGKTLIFDYDITTGGWTEYVLLDEGLFRPLTPEARQIVVIADIQPFKLSSEVAWRRGRLDLRVFGAAARSRAHVGQTQ
jgi:hypothetical protein